MDRPTIPLGYVAGVIDARGHIEVNNRHGKPQPRVRITTKRIELLEHLAKLTGSKVVTDRVGYNRRACSEHCQDQHQHVQWQSIQWTVDSARATIVLYNIQPLIVAQIDKVREALTAGLNAFPPERGNTPQVMYDLGWEVPDELAGARLRAV
jgi:hypothetical protein